MTARHHPSVLPCILAGLLVVALAALLSVVLRERREPMESWGVAASE